MQFPALNDAQNRLNAARADLKRVFDEAGDNLDMNQVKSLSGDSADKVEWIRTKNAEIEDLAKKAAELAELADVAGAVRAEAGVKHAERGTELKSDSGLFVAETGDLGEAFVQSRAFKGYQPGAGRGEISNLNVGVKTLFQTSAGVAPETLRNGVIVDFATRPAPQVVNFIPQTATGQAAVVYMEETTFTNNAAEVAEGATFGEAALAMTERSQTVRKLGVWIPVTDEQLEDVAYARSYVNNRLPFMLRQRLDSQVLNGDGVAPNLLGTKNVSGIQTQAKGTDSIPDAIYKAFVLVRHTAFAEPSVVFINPSDWQDVRLLKTADGLYIWGAPHVAGLMTIWGVPVVETTALTAGTAVTGDYSNFSELAIRRGIDVQVTNSHSDFFINGKLAIRADMRVAMVHYRPAAFCTITGI